MKISVDELLRDSARVRDLSPEEISAVLVALGSMQSVLAARLVESNDKRLEAPDELLTAAEAAAILKVPPSWFYRRPDLPFRVSIDGKNARFSARGLQRFIEGKTGRKS